MDKHRILMTPELGGRLKTFRNQYNIKAKDVATMLNKSAAYVSKLEKGEIQQIEKREFVRIVNYIVNADDGYEKFFEYISDLADEEELEKNAFILNFEWVERKIPVPAELVEYINGKINKNKIDIEQLATYINKNDDLEETFFEEYNIDRQSVEPNVWTNYYELDSSCVKRNFIVVKIDKDEIEQILNRREVKSNYLSIYVVLYHIYKLEELEKHLVIDEKTRRQLKKKTEEKLQTYKFYTLGEKKKRISQAQGNEQLAETLNKFDYDNRMFTIQLIEYLSALSDFDVSYTNKKLEGIIKNFDKTDASFAIAYMAISLEGLNGLPNSTKHDFLKSVNELIQKYSNMTDSVPGYERY